MKTESMKTPAVDISDKNKILENVMNEYSDMLLRTALLIIKDFRLAEDVVQETFINFYYSIDNYRREASVKTYLSKILINECRQKMRKSWFRKTFLSNETDNTLLFSSNTLDDSVERMNLCQGLMKLDFKYREVLLLYYYNDLSMKEISDVLGQPEGTIKSRLKRGRDKLKIIIQEDLINE